MVKREGMWAKQDPRPPRQLGRVPAEPFSMVRTYGSLLMSLKMLLNCSGTNRRSPGVGERPSLALRTGTPQERGHGWRLQPPGK